MMPGAKITTLIFHHFSKALPNFPPLPYLVPTVTTWYGEERGARGGSVKGLTQHHNETLVELEPVELRHHI